MDEQQQVAGEVVTMDQTTVMPSVGGIGGSSSAMDATVMVPAIPQQPGASAQVPAPIPMPQDAAVKVPAAPSSEQIAARGQAMTLVHGFGLFYGEYDDHGKRREWTATEWDGACAQAVDDKISVVYPKVCDGITSWGDLAWLNMLKNTADQHGLLCFPVIRCYVSGPVDNYLQIEASYTITIGQIFGGVCVEMGREWEESFSGATCATQFGSIVRAQFEGTVLPILPAATVDHLAFPYIEILSWASGWFAIAYKDEWMDTTKQQQMTAQDVVQKLYPQWMLLNKQLAAHGIVPPATLPVIELGRYLPESEVLSWLQQMKVFGCCSFWYDRLFPRYAATVQQAPEPSWDIGVVTTSSLGKVLASIWFSGPHAEQPTPAPVLEIQDDMLSGVQQNLSASDLQISWWIVDPALAYDPTSPIVLLWTKLLERMYGIGAPISDSRIMTIADVVFVVQEFEGGRIFYRATESGGRVWAQPVNQNRLPGKFGPQEPITLPATNGKSPS